MRQHFRLEDTLNESRGLAHLIKGKGSPHSKKRAMYRWPWRYQRSDEQNVNPSLNDDNGAPNYKDIMLGCIIWPVTMHETRFVAKNRDASCPGGYTDPKCPAAEI